jgi:hypothetical protein
MARLNYAYGNFLVTAPGTDGSSVLSTGNQYYTYPHLPAVGISPIRKFMDKTALGECVEIEGGWGNHL